MEKIVSLCHPVSLWHFDAYSEKRESGVCCVVFEFERKKFKHLWYWLSARNFVNAWNEVMQNDVEIKSSLLWHTFQILNRSVVFEFEQKKCKHLWYWLSARNFVNEWNEVMQNIFQMLNRRVYLWIWKKKLSSCDTGCQREILLMNEMKWCKMM